VPSNLQAAEHDGVRNACPRTSKGKGALYAGYIS
jgi:hypothetical protein